MSYYIEDTGASLRFTSEDGFFFLMKKDINAIRFVRDGLIMVDTGCCFNNIFIYVHQVSSPLADDAEELANTLNSWMGLPSEFPETPIPSL